MTVYVVCFRNDTNTRGFAEVFSTRERAERYINAGKDADDFFIEEVGVDWAPDGEVEVVTLTESR